MRSGGDRPNQLSSLAAAIAATWRVPARPRRYFRRLFGTSPRQCFPARDAAQSKCLHSRFSRLDNLLARGPEVLDAAVEQSSSEGAFDRLKHDTAAAILDAPAVLGSWIRRLQHEGEGLVPRFSQIDGYRCLSLIRASAVVNCQSALAWLAFRSSSQAAISSMRVCLSGMRRSRHWDERTPSSDSAISSQLPCFGV